MTVITTNLVLVKFAVKSI